MASGFVRDTWTVSPKPPAFPDSVKVPCTPDGSPTVIAAGSATWTVVVKAPSP